MSDSLRTHGLQHARLPCPSPTPKSFSNSTSIELVMPSNHLIPYRPLLLLPSIFPSIRVFSNESVLHVGWPKYLCFSNSPSKEYSVLISFRMDWFDLLVVQGTLKSLLQHHSSKASILWLSAFFTVQLSHSYITTGKTIALIIWTFVVKVMSLLLTHCLGFKKFCWSRLDLQWCVSFRYTAKLQVYMYPFSCVCINESLCCIPESNTALLTNHTPIKLKKN